MKSKLLVSACPMKFQVWYNGNEKAQLAATPSRWRQTGWLVIHCSELATGLSTPRLPTEIVGSTGGGVLIRRARIVESSGHDVTGHYQLAAWLTLSAARRTSCQAALLANDNPACGGQFVYDGSPRGRRRTGTGVTADLLHVHGITAFSDGQIPQLLAWIVQGEQGDDSM